jgi:hypothetical protein
MPMNFDEMWMTPAVEMAHTLFRDHVPGAAFDGEPFMGTSDFELGGKRMLACSCFYHTVVFFEHRDVTHAAVYTTDEGGMVPWVGGAPDTDMLQEIFQLPNQPFIEFLEANDLHRARVEAQQAAQQGAAPTGQDVDVEPAEETRHDAPRN